MKTKTNLTSPKLNFVLQSLNRVGGTTIVQAGFETPNAALAAYDGMTSRAGFGGIRVCRKIEATGALNPWTAWLPC